MSAKFKDIAIGQTFDFVGPNRMTNSFYDRCKKTSARGYTPIEGPLKGQKLRVGSISASVFHVDVGAKKNPRKRGHSGRFVKQRFLSPTQSREFFDRMYEREELARQSAHEAFLGTPEGEAWRQAENKKRLASLKKNPRPGMTAYFETVRDGFVTVKVIGVKRSEHGGTEITMRVSRAHRGYKVGEIIKSTGLHVFPKANIRRTKYSTYVRPYNWAQHIGLESNPRKKRRTRKIGVRKNPGYRAVLIAGKGTLLGGVKKHVSSVFSHKRDAQAFLDQAIETNRAAGRDVERSYIIGSKNRAEIVRIGKHIGVSRNPGQFVICATIASRAGKHWYFRRSTESFVDNLADATKYQSAAHAYTVAKSIKDQLPRAIKSIKVDAI